MRENRTQGSARGLPGNGKFYLNDRFLNSPRRASSNRRKEAQELRNGNLVAVQKEWGHSCPRIVGTGMSLLRLCL